MNFIKSRGHVRNDNLKKNDFDKKSYLFFPGLKNKAIICVESY